MLKVKLKGGKLMESSNEDPGYNLFAYLYKKRRTKDRRPELGKKELIARTNAHWKALNTEKRRMYKDEAEKRLKRGSKKSVHVSRHEDHCSGVGSHCSSSKHRGRVMSSSHACSSKKSVTRRSRSPIRSRRDSRRERSWSASSARTEYLGDDDSSCSDNSSYTDTASTYYDDDCDRSDATSCSSIASSYDDDLTEATQIDILLPSTSKARKPRPATKTTKSKTQRKPVESKRKVRRATKRAGKKSSVMETATKTTNTTPMPARKNIAAVAAIEKPEKKRVRVKRTTKVSKQAAKGRSRGRPTKARVPRVVKSRKTIPLKKTPASLSVNLRSQDLKQVETILKSTPPRQSVSDSKLKVSASDAAVCRSEGNDQVQEAEAV